MALTRRLDWTALRCSLCGGIVMELDLGAGDILLEPIMIRARCKNRRRCSMPWLMWQIRRPGYIERVSLDMAKEHAIA